MLQHTSFVTITKTPHKIYTLFTNSRRGTVQLLKNNKKYVKIKCKMCFCEYTTAKRKVNLIMKRLLSMVLCLAIVLSTFVFVSGAVSDNCIRINDTNGATGYSAAANSISAKIKEEGGVTVVMNVLVESFTTAPEGMFSQIAAFTGAGAGKYNLLSYDFGAKAFKAGQSARWISETQEDYVPIQTNAFSWQCDKWYELAFRFNGNKAAMYLNGICVISTEFDAAQHDYFILYPQYCTVRVDNIRICDKTYNVADGAKDYWASENYTGIESVNDSAVWSASTYQLNKDGCNDIADTFVDTRIELNDTNGATGYSAAQDQYNALVAANGGVTLIADVMIKSYAENVPAGYAPMITAFTGEYNATARYNFMSYDIAAGAFEANESGAWISNSQADLGKNIGSADYALETGVWYEMAWQFNGNKGAMYLNGNKVLEATFSEVVNKYIILYPQYCNIQIDNIRLCDKNFDVANGTGTMYTAENFTGVTSNSTSDVFYFDPAYKIVSVDTTPSGPVGDADGDGKITSSDLSLLYRIVSGSSVEYASGADVDMNGAITATDLTLLSRILQGYSYTVGNSLGVTPIVPDNSAVVDGGSTDVTDTAVEAVIAKISAIGTVTYKSLSAIQAAESAYANLTNAQKAKVTNIATLTTARSTWDALDAEVVTYKNTVAALPAVANTTDACRTAIANCAIAYATLTSPGQVDAVATEKAKYDAFRADWEKLLSEEEADVDKGNGSGDTSGIDESALKFTASGAASYSLLFSSEPQSYTDMALTFDVFVESIDSGVDFAGLGVWSGNGTDGRSSFTGYDFVDKRFTTDNNTFYPSAPSADSNYKMNLAVGEWNHFVFRRLNNNTMQVYVNGNLCYETTGYNYANTYFIFGFKNCTAYVDNYQYYHDGIACGLITDFTTGASTDASGYTRFADGGYWVVGSLNFAGVVKGKPGFDGSALKFDGTTASSYTLVLNEGPISNTDVALTFDVYVESIDSTQNFAGLGVWNGDGTFIGYDFKDQKFTAAKNQGYPYPPDNDNGESLKLNIGEWNHFVFRRLNNNSYVVYVNGVKGAEITGLSFDNTYMIFGFKNCVGYIDNYQAYQSGTGKGLYTDFSQFTKRSDGALVSPDGGYWIVGTQGFAGIYTTKTGGATGSGFAGSSAVPGSNAVDGTHRINLDSGSSGGSSGGTTTGDANLQKILTNIQNSGNIPSNKKAACSVVATELYNLGYETAFIAGVLGNLCHEGNTGIFEYYNTNTNYHPNFNSYLQTYYGTTYKAMFSGKYIYNMNLDLVYEIFTNLSNMNWQYNGVRIGTGVGCIQWTFGRSYNLIKIYREVTNNGSSITKEQALAAEGLMVSRELSGGYKSVYTTWKSNNASNINSQDAAYNAAYDVCTKYERPSNMYESGKTRGNFAKLVYADLIK